MDDFVCIRHKEFKYVFIPAEPSDPVDERTFEGTEGEFQTLIADRFALEKDPSAELSAKYEIVSLTVPTKINGFTAVNGYINSVGRKLGLSTNSRATRIASTDIRGDCFISKTFDDESEFKRIDFDSCDYESMLSSPPSSKGRFDPQKTLTSLKKPEEVLRSTAFCEACRKENINLFTCSKCHKVSDELLFYRVPKRRLGLPQADLSAKKPLMIDFDRDEAPREGIRGGLEQFRWDSVKSQSLRDRECYLGQSLKIGMQGKFGRFQRHDWWSTGNDRQGDVGRLPPTDTDFEDIRKLEKAMQDEALGLKPKNVLLNPTEAMHSIRAGIPMDEDEQRTTAKRLRKVKRISKEKTKHRKLNCDVEEEPQNSQKYARTHEVEPSRAMSSRLKHKEGDGWPRGNNQSPIHSPVGKWPGGRYIRESSANGRIGSSYRYIEEPHGKNSYR